VETIAFIAKYNTFFEKAEMKKIASAKKAFLIKEEFGRIVDNAEMNELVTTP
jgi:hypothetical protein